MIKMWALSDGATLNDNKRIASCHRGPPSGAALGAPNPLNGAMTSVSSGRTERLQRQRDRALFRGFLNKLMAAKGRLETVSAQSGAVAEYYSKIKVGAMGKEGHWEL